MSGKMHIRAISRHRAGVCEAKVRMSNETPKQGEEQYSSMRCQ